MSEQTIWNALRSAGLSAAGAAGMMGNMYCESSLQSNNVENRCAMSDADYTHNTDSGRYTKDQFTYDSYGYGLCQWTYWSRKKALYELAKSKGVSIADEAMQCEYCISELFGYPELLNFLKTTNDVYTAASRVCTEFERPAVNNIHPRYNKAQEYYNKYKDTSVTETQQAETPDTQPIQTTQSTESCTIEVRTLRRGDKGRDVFMLQCGLNDMGYNCGVADGDFGQNTENGVNYMKYGYALEQNGIADQDVWQILFQ